MRYVRISKICCDVNKRSLERTPFLFDEVSLLIVVMIETECFRELNVMEQNGELVWNLRNDSIRGENSKSESNNKFGFLARLFKRKTEF